MAERYTPAVSARRCFAPAAYVWVLGALHLLAWPGLALRLRPGRAAAAKGIVERRAKAPATPLFRGGRYASPTCAASLRSAVHKLRVNEMFEIIEKGDFGWGSRFQNHLKGAFKKRAAKVKVWPTEDEKVTWGDITGLREHWLYEATRLFNLTYLGTPLLAFENTTNMRGVCDLSMNTLKFLTSSPILAVLRRQVTACYDRTDLELSGSLRVALDRTCFEKCAAQLKNTIPRCLEPAPDEEFNFEPGPIGAQVDPGSGVVSGVKGGQAQKFGIRARWQVEKIDGKAYTMERLEKRQNGSHAYTLRFVKSEVLSATWFIGALQKSLSCYRTPQDSIEGLADYLYGRQCEVFSDPSPLWNIDTKAFDSSSQTGPDAVCYEGNDTTTKDRQFTVIGMCLEGTVCSCPNTENHKSIMSTEDLQASSSRRYVKAGAANAGTVGLQAAKAFGSAVVAAHIEQLKIHAAVAGTILGLQALGLAGGAAAVAGTGLIGPAIGPLIIPAIAGSIVARIFAKRVVSHLMFSCETTLGCWPPNKYGRAWHDGWRAVQVRGSDVCRMPEEVKTYGNPLWFIPMPGTMLEMKGTWCKLKPCSAWLMEAEAVGLHASVGGKIQVAQALLQLAAESGVPVSGPRTTTPPPKKGWFSNLFRYRPRPSPTPDAAAKTKEAAAARIQGPVSKPNLLNCQRLPFEDMSKAQRAKFLKLLRASGLGQEQSLGPAEGKLVKTFGATTKARNVWRGLEGYKQTDDSIWGSKYLEKGVRFFATKALRAQLLMPLNTALTIAQFAPLLILR